MVSRAVKMAGVDTVAMVLFSVIGGVLTIGYEVGLLGLTGQQWLAIRLLYNPARFIGARLCGKLTNWIRFHLAAESPNWWQKAVSDTIAVSVYQIPIYVLSALIAQVEPGIIGIAVLMYLLENICIGWLYGVILDWVRKLAYVRVASAN
jgi:hypothetical protein